MTQTYQMKHNPQGTIYSLLTVESDGRMTMTFHGTDREISHEVTENADGWLCCPGGMFPGLESGKWNKMEDVTLRGQSPCNPPSATHTGDSPSEPRPRRQRKPRTNNRETITNNREPSDIIHQPIPADAPTRSLSALSNQTSSTLKAVGMVAAATVALLVIYETGLLIPLGLIGLATGGILK